jgi:GNAT superfamily N-acetyltransferase
MTTATKAKQEFIVTRYSESYDPDVTRLCKAFSEESLAEYGLAVEADRLMEMTEVCKGVSFFLKVDGKVVGLIAGMKQENLTNGALALQEVVWYVDKEYRANGRILLKYFEEAAKNMGASCVVMGLMCNSGMDKLDKFYKRMGYKPFEIQYMKEIT